MESSTNILESILDNAGCYLETKVDLLKLKAVKKSSESISSIASTLVIVIIFILSVFTLNIGLALWIGELLGSNYYGFFVIGGSDAIIGLVFFLCRKQWLKAPVTNIIISKMMN